MVTSMLLFSCYSGSLIINQLWNRDALTSCSTCMLFSWTLIGAMLLLTLLLCELKFNPKPQRSQVQDRQSIIYFLTQWIDREIEQLHTDSQEGEATSSLDMLLVTNRALNSQSKTHVPREYCHTLSMDRTQISEHKNN